MSAHPYNTRNRGVVPDIRGDPPDQQHRVAAPGVAVYPVGRALDPLETRRRWRGQQAALYQQAQAVYDEANRIVQNVGRFPLLTAAATELRTIFSRYLRPGPTASPREVQAAIDVLNQITGNVNFRAANALFERLPALAQVVNLPAVDNALYQEFRQALLWRINTLRTITTLADFLDFANTELTKGQSLYERILSYVPTFSDTDEEDEEEEEEQEEEEEEQQDGGDNYGDDEDDVPSDTDTVPSAPGYYASRKTQVTSEYNRRREIFFAHGDDSLYGGPHSFFNNNGDALNYMDESSGWRVFFRPLFTPDRVLNREDRIPDGEDDNWMFREGFGQEGENGLVVPGTRSAEWIWIFERLGLPGNQYTLPSQFRLRVTRSNQGCVIPAYLAAVIRSALARGDIQEDTHLRVSMAFGRDAREVANRRNGGLPPSYLLRTTNAYPVFHQDLSLTVRTMNLLQFARMCAEAESLILPPQEGEDDGNRPSGLNLSPNESLWLRFMIWSFTGAYIAGRWSAELEEEIKERCGCSGLYFPRNSTDNFCFEYSVLAGLIKYNMNGVDVLYANSNPESGSFDVRGLLYAAANMVYKDDKMKRYVEKVLALALNTENARPLLPISRPDDTLESLTFEELRKRIDEFSDENLPENVGVDVYMLDNKRKQKHIFPCYQAHGKRCKEGSYIIPILCFMSSLGQAHYCLIRDKRRFFRKNEGRVFFSCSKCRRTFISRKQLTNHICTEEAVFVKSSYDDIDDMPSYGVCKKCLLEFKTKEEMIMHNRECFMKGRTGYRQVRLIDPPEGNDPFTFKPKLLSERNEIRTETRKMEKELIYFGDFESWIEEIDGEHHIMSFGLFNEKGKKFVIGKTIEEMFKLIIDDALSEGVKIARLFFHNAMNYDSNFIFKWLTSSEKAKKWKVDGVMKQINKFQQLRIITDEKIQIIIGDTYQFLTMSLEGLVESVKSKSEDIEENKRVFPRFFEVMHSLLPFVEEADINKILRKNPFPYTWFNSPEKLEESFSTFLEIFKDKTYFKANVDLEKAYEHAKWVGETFHLETAGAYHDIYLSCDVLQLADIFMHAEQMFMKTHNIILRNYVGIPAATWHAFLRNTPGLDLPLYRSAHEALFFKAMTRGGVTCASTRFAEVDGKSESIIYLDVNGLYPFVMREKYPCKYLYLQNVHDCEGDDARRFIYDLAARCELNGEGFCAEVDLIYPHHLHDYTDDFPFAPEHLVTEASDYEASKYISDWLFINPNEPPPHFEGLVGTLRDKKNYCTHWRILMWYLKMGLIVNKVHTVVRFKEDNYLASYVQKNISLRNERTDGAGKMFYKLAGNALYGKTFENPFNHGKCVIVRDHETMAHLLENGNISQIGFSDGESTVVKMDGEKVYLDKPTYIGPIVTEYAKLHMYKLFYEEIMGIFGRANMKLLYTDTDSFIIRIRHPEGVESTEQLFAYIKERKPDLIGSIGGQVKSETGNTYGITKYIGLRAKSYYYETEDGHICKKSKGTTHDAQDTLSFAEYASALFDKKVIERTNVVFKRTAFSVSTIESERRALSSNDGKRIILEDGISTHAIGYAGNTSSLSSPSSSSFSNLN